MKHLHTPTFYSLQKDFKETEFLAKTLFLLRNANTCFDEWSKRIVPTKLFLFLKEKVCE